MFIYAPGRSGLSIEQAGEKIALFLGFGLGAVKVGGIELTDWVRKGGYILTNQESDEVDMDYVLAHGSVTIANFPSHFVAALRQKLASDLAYDLVHNSALGERLLEEYETIVLPRAIGLDNREIYSQEYSSSWANAGHTTQTIE